MNASGSVRTVAVALLVVLTLAGTAAARGDQVSDRAAAAFDDGRFAEAARLYAVLAADHPDDWRYVFRQGLALHFAGDYAAAAPRHEAAAAFEACRPPALFNLACARARLGETDAAFAALTAALESGYDDHESVTEDPDLASLRTDARFAALLRAHAPRGHPPLTWETLRARLDAEAADGFAGAVLVVRAGEVVLREGYGLANRSANTPVTPETIFAIGSTPIDFTRAGILLLAQDGKIRPTDRISTFFPEVPADKRAITVEHLLSGRSGLHDFHDLPSDRDPDHAWIDRDEAVRRILAKELLFPPGSDRAHSHSAWGLLAAIIEVVSGQSYPAYTGERLFAPAGMTDTGFFGSPLDPARTAIGYGDRTDGTVNAPPYWGPTSWLVMGSGGMVSTVDDLHRWLRALADGTILGPEWLRHYWSPANTLMNGGNHYGFEIYFTENPESFMLFISNVNNHARRRANDDLARDLATLVQADGLPRFALGIMMDVSGEGDIVLSGVAPGGAAERDGLRAGDVLISVGRRPLGEDPLAVLDPYLHSGDRIPFTVERDGKRIDVVVTPNPRD